MTITKQFKDIVYDLEIKPNNRHIYLVIKNNRLIVKSNNSSNLEIESILYKKYNWIKKKLNNQTAPVVIQKNLLTGSLINFLGNKYLVDILPKTNKNNYPVIRKNKFIIFGEYSYYHTNVLNTFYEFEAERHINKFLDKWTKIMNLYPNKVSFRNIKTRWGSCSSKNNLSFNINLAQLPIDIIEYIVVHELSHIKYKNHSYQFWSLVSKFLPNQQNLRKELRKYEGEIIFYK